MSGSPPSQRKSPSQLAFNPQYLNFIRRNHLKFQLEERSLSKLKDKSSSSINQYESQKEFDDRKQFYAVSSQKKLDILTDQKVEKNENSDRIEGDQRIREQTQKNYRTLDVAEIKRLNSFDSSNISNKAKYMLTGGDEAVVMKNNTIKHHHKHNSEGQTQNLSHPHIQQQSLLLNAHFIQLLQRKNKQIAQQLLQSDKNQRAEEQSSSPNVAKKVQKIGKTDETTSLLMKKNKNVRDLWKEKFLNLNCAYGSNKNQKRQDKKKPYAEIKFPNIFRTRSQRQTQSHQEEYCEEQLGECSLVMKSKPKLPQNPNPHQNTNNQAYQRLSVTMLHQNHSLQLVSYEHPSQQSQQQQELQHLRQSKQLKQSIQTYQAQLKKQIPPEYQSPLLYYKHQKNSSVSVIKRRRNVPQKVTNFLVLTDPLSHNSISKSNDKPTHSNRKPNYKQMAKQKDKQFENYLIQNEILKSAKLQNYNQRQEQKKKMIFMEWKEKQKLKRENSGQAQRQLKSRNHLQRADSKDIQECKQPPSTQQQSTLLKSTEMYTQPPLTSALLQATSQSNLIPFTDKSPIKKKLMNINLLLRKDPQLSIYEIKIRSYREFLFMLNLAHKVFLPLNLKPASQVKNQAKFTYYIGKGNNRLLIKSLMNRRFWWEQTKQMNKANFVWTQLKVNQLYQYQKVSQYPKKQNKFDKLESQNPNSPITKKKKPFQKSPQKASSYKAPLPDQSQLKVFTSSDFSIYSTLITNLSQNPQSLTNFSNRLKYLPSQQSLIYPAQGSLKQQKVHNHLEFNYFIGNKKALFYNMKNYYSLIKKDVFEVIPFTLHIKKGVQDPAYNIFLKQYKKVAKQQEKTGLKNLWIVKPGQLSNRGQGITVIDEVYELNNILKKKEKHNNGSQKSYILQKYLQRPLLYKNRKFDIRHYLLLTKLHGRFRAYFYGQGYIRTSSHQFKLDQLDQMIHLTNDAIQKYGDNYGKHQDGNKVSYTEFQRYMDSVYGEGKKSFADQIYPRMKSIALDAVKATYAQMDTKGLEHNFQLLGLDFMIDSKFNVWLIQVNTNPCLELSSKLLQRLIPQMAQNTIRLTIDPLFPPPTQYPNSLKHLCPDSPLQRLQYQLIFDQARDGQQVEELFKKCNLRQLYKEMGQVDEEDQVFQNDGKQIQLKGDNKEDNQ